MKELLARPGFLPTEGTLGADISYLLAVVFTTLFLIAWRMAKKAEGTRHHKLILVSMLSMLIYFLGYYYARQLGVLVLEGKEGFGGSEHIYQNVFMPILTTRSPRSTRVLMKNPTSGSSSDRVRLATALPIGTSWVPQLRPIKSWKVASSVIMNRR